MRTFFILALTFLTSYYAIAQQFEVETIQMNGSKDKLINLVVLGDGYTQSQLNQFVNDARNTTNAFFAEPPFSYYKNYFNVFAIKVPSNVSGAANDPSHLIDNYFGSTYNYYYGIERLLYPTHLSKVMTVLANNFPEYDHVAMIVNDARYGGGGGWLAAFSTHSSSMEIFLHEFAHSFADLADEYWAGPQYADEKINMTQNTNLTTLKWKNWYGSNNIGLYPFQESPTWYRPHQNCKMQYLGSRFCSVCSEGIVEHIHTLVSPLHSYSPVSNNVVYKASPLTFSLNLIAPNPNSLRTEWNLNGSLFKLNSDEITISATDLRQGMNQLSVRIEDATNLLRIDNHQSIHSSVINWNIDKQGDVGVHQTSKNALKVFVENKSIFIENAPNYTVMTASGQIIATGACPAGKQSVSGLTQGVYIVKTAEKTVKVLVLFY